MDESLGCELTVKEIDLVLVDYKNLIIAKKMFMDAPTKEDIAYMKLVQNIIAKLKIQRDLLNGGEEKE